MASLNRLKFAFVCIVLFFTVFSLGLSSSLGSINYGNLLSKETKIVIGPFSQNPTPNSTIIFWQTSSKTCANSICYGPNISCGNILFCNLTSYFHRIKITNLIPSKTYYYKVISDEIESKLYTFNTAADANDSIKFVVYGDTRGVWDSWKNASIVAQGIEKESPDFVLHTGDIVNDGRVQKQWIDFFNISEFTHNSTIFPSIGNHEYLSFYYSKYFITDSNRYWYSFDYGPAHFVSLDSNVINAVNFRQLIWLFKDLKENIKPVVFVFFHYPPYSSGNHGSAIHLRLLWGNIFRYFEVDMVFNGHDHSYERGFAKDTHYIVSGGGGAPLYDVGSKWWTVYSEKTHHYCLLEVNVDFVSFVAKKSDGSIFDSFSYNI